MIAGPEPQRVLDAQRRAAYAAEHVPSRSIQDWKRILAFDVLLEFVEGLYDGPRDQVAWALLWAEHAEQIAELEPHEVRLRDDAWRKIHADRARWARLGLTER